MSTEQTKIELLEARIDHLQEQLDQLLADRPEVTDRDTSDDTRDDAVSRRRLMKLAGGAVAAGAVGALAQSDRAAADDPNDLTLGATNSHSIGRTAGNYTGSLSGGAAFLFQSGTAFSTGSAAYPAALAGYTTRPNRPTGIYGYSDVANGNGVVGSKVGGAGYGVYARNTSTGGTALFAEGSSNSGRGVDARGEIAGFLSGDKYGIYTQGKSAAVLLTSEVFGDHPPTRTDSHTNGELEPSFRFGVGCDLWLCVKTGTPGEWRKLAGPETAGALHAVDPTRVYDSRQAQPSQGKLNAGQNRVISVADGRNVNGGAVITPNLVPVGATAVMYNLTLDSTAGGGFLSVTPGDAASAKASAINWTSSGLAIANAGLVKLDDDRQIKVFCGAGATHFIIDITGYYL